MYVKWPHKNRNIAAKMLMKQRQLKKSDQVGGLCVQGRGNSITHTEKTFIYLVLMSNDFKTTTKAYLMH